MSPLFSQNNQPRCTWLGSGRANWAVSGFHHPAILELFNPSATNCAISVDSNQQKAWTHCQGCWWFPCRLIVTFQGLGNPRPAMWQRSHCSFTRNGSPSTQALSSVAWAMAHKKACPQTKFTNSNFDLVGWWCVLFWLCLQQAFWELSQNNKSWKLHNVLTQMHSNLCFTIEFMKGLTLMVITTWTYFHGLMTSNFYNSDFPGINQRILIMSPMTSPISRFKLFSNTYLYKHIYIYAK